jgi:hypothetical protein
MSIDNDLDAFQSSRDACAHTAAVPHQAIEAARHFLVPWRLIVDTTHLLWQQGDDAGCGQGPVD